VTDPETVAAAVVVPVPDPVVVAAWSLLEPHAITTALNKSTNTTLDLVVRNPGIPDLFLSAAVAEEVAHEGRQVPSAERM